MQEHRLKHFVSIHSYVKCYFYHWTMFHSFLKYSKICFKQTPKIQEHVTNDIKNNLHKFGAMLLPTLLIFICLLQSCSLS